MRTSHKARDAAAEKQSYVCDTFTGALGHSAENPQKLMAGATVTNAGARS
jgi:hypothetical protein